MSDLRLITTVHQKRKERILASEEEYLKALVAHFGIVLGDIHPVEKPPSFAVDDESFLVIPGAMDVGKNEPPCSYRFSRPGSRPDIQRQIEVELGSEGLRGQVLQFSFVI